jgi:hypothetical protein
MQIALLEHGLYQIKMDFNERFLALRDVKRTICQRLKAKFQDIREVNAALGADESLQDPVMKPDEEPENKFVVTDDDIAEFMMLRLQKQSGAGAGLDDKAPDAQEATSSEGERHIARQFPLHRPPASLRTAPFSELQQVACNTVDRRMVCTLWSPRALALVLGQTPTCYECCVVNCSHRNYIDDA